MLIPDLSLVVPPRPVLPSLLPQWHMRVHDDLISAVLRPDMVAAAGRSFLVMADPRARGQQAGACLVALALLTSGFPPVFRHSPCLLK